MPTTPTNSSATHLNNIRSSRRKRGLEPEESELIHTSTAKKAKAYKMSANDVNEIKNFILSMKSDIENKIDSSQSSIEEKISDLSTSVNAEVHELKNSINDLRSTFNTDIDAIKIHIKDHKHRLDINEDDINRLKLSADLRMNGIPYSQNENVVELFHKIAKIIGYDSTIMTNVPLIKRIPVRNKTTGNMVESSIISFHFSSIQHKQLFYSMYLNKMPLKPESIGLSNELKIIIGESLTRTNAQLFKFAQNLKKEKKIAQVFTADGLVKVRIAKGPNERTHTIRHHTQLEILVKEYEQKQQQQQQQKLPSQSQNQTHAEPMEHESAHKTNKQNNNEASDSIDLTNGATFNVHEANNLDPLQQQQLAQQQLLQWQIEQQQQQQLHLIQQQQSMTINAHTSNPS